MTMEAQEIIKKVRKIEIKARGLSSNIFAGQYHTAFKGRGMAFSEVRDYQFGDDVRDIDWNVTARFHRPYVKVFEEERELTVMLLIDVSGSLDFGTRRQMKRDMVTEIAATLAFSAIQNNDKTGVIFFSDKIEKYIPPKKGRRHILYIIREMLDFKGESRRTDINVALQFLSSVIKRRCATVSRSRSPSATASTTSLPYRSTTPLPRNCPMWACSRWSTPRPASSSTSTRAAGACARPTASTGSTARPCFRMRSTRATSTTYQYPPTKISSSRCCCSSRSAADGFSRGAAMAAMNANKDTH